HLVTLLEEMPVQETADGIADLAHARLPVGGVVVNLVRPQDLDPSELAAARAGTLDATAISTDLGRAGVTVSDELVAGLPTEAAGHAERRAREDEQRGVVASRGVPSYELPRRAGGIDLGCLYELAELLKEQGLA